MSGDIAAGSVAARILTLLGERYPCREEEIGVALGVRPDTVRLEVKRLAARGLVVVEEVGGVRWVALSGAGRLGRPAPRQDDDPAFR